MADVASESSAAVSRATEELSNRANLAVTSASADVASLSSASVDLAAKVNSMLSASTADVTSVTSAALADASAIGLDVVERTASGWAAVTEEALAQATEASAWTAEASARLSETSAAKVAAITAELESDASTLISSLGRLGEVSPASIQAVEDTRLTITKIADSALSFDLSGLADKALETTAAQLDGVIPIDGATLGTAAALGVLFTLASAANDTPIDPADADLRKEYTAYCIRYGKRYYDDAVWADHFARWKLRYDQVQRHNADLPAGVPRLELNANADLPEEDLQAAQ